MACLHDAPVHVGRMTVSFLSSHYIQSARFGSLSPYVRSYITLVQNKGYKPTTILRQLQVIARLNRWLLRMDSDLGGLGERVLEHFQKCEQKKRRTSADGARVTLQRLLDVLRDARVAPPAERSSVPQTAVQCLTERYRRHLLDDQGLAESTVVNYTWHVQKFLSEQFGAGAVNLISLQAQDAITFIRHTARDHSTRHAQLLVAALRSFFRFLHYQGEIETDLAPALPNVANWALSSLPKYISAAAVQRVLDEAIGKQPLRDATTPCFCFWPGSECAAVKCSALILRTSTGTMHASLSAPARGQAGRGCRLMQQRQASPHTFSSYRDTFHQFLKFTEQRLRKEPSRLIFQEIDAPLITAFLDHLEKQQGLGTRSRNLRLTALRAFFRFAAFEAPTHSAQIQRVLAIPSKRFTRTLVQFLTRAEVDALLAAPDQRTWSGRHDHAFILLAVQTGLRLSEMTGLKRQDIILGAGAHVRLIGKGRKERCTPIARSTLSVLRAWLREPQRGDGHVLFPNTKGERLSVHAVQDLLKQASRDGFQPVPFVETQTCHRAPLEAHHGHGSSASRRRSFCDRIVARSRTC
jgi:site-specific recombinase XerD